MRLPFRLAATACLTTLAMQSASAQTASAPDDVSGRTSLSTRLGGPSQPRRVRVVQVPTPSGTDALRTGPMVGVDGLRGGSGGVDALIGNSPFSGTDFRLSPIIQASPR